MMIQEARHGQAPNQSFQQTKIPGVQPGRVANQSFQWMTTRSGHQCRRTNLTGNHTRAAQQQRLKVAQNLEHRAERSERVCMRCRDEVERSQELWQGRQRRQLRHGSIAIARCSSSESSLEPLCYAEQGFMCFAPLLGNSMQFPPLDEELHISRCFVTPAQCMPETVRLYAVEQDRVRVNCLLTSSELLASILAGSNQAQSSRTLGTPYHAG
jgi:hypothetical protein